MRGEDWLGDIVGILGMPGRYKGEEEAGHEAANASNQHERKILYFLSCLVVYIWRGYK